MVFILERHVFTGSIDIYARCSLIDGYDSIVYSQYECPRDNIVIFIGENDRDGYEYRRYCRTNPSWDQSYISVSPYINNGRRASFFRQHVIYPEHSYSSTHYPRHW